MVGTRSGAQHVPGRNSLCAGVLPPTPPSESPPLELQRVTRANKRARKEVEVGDSIAITNTNPFINFRGGGDTGTKLDELVDLISTLNTRIKNQNNTIETIATTLADIKREQQAVQAQNVELQKQILDLKSQLEVTRQQRSRTWANVATGTESATATHGHEPQSPRQANQQRDHDANCIRISTKPNYSNNDNDHNGEDENESDNGNNSPLTRYLPTDVVVSKIKQVLENNEATRAARVLGVGTTRTGYVIRFHNKDAADAARSDEQWLRSLGNDTRVVKPRYGVVVHRVPTDGIDLEHHKTKCIDKIVTENDLTTKGHRLLDAAWLKAKDQPLGRHASLGLWYETSNAAEEAIKNGLVFGQQYIGSVEAYQMRRKTCHRCARTGHLAWVCKERKRCSHCSGPHERRECPPGTPARCLDCHLEHATGHRTCRGRTTTIMSQ